MYLVENTSSGDTEMVKPPEKQALEYFAGPYNCTQSVLKALLEHKGIQIDQATEFASGFGAGITYSGQQCGAISGAMMAIGILEGLTNSDVRKHKSKTYKRSSELHTRFKAEFGSIVCDELTGIDMSDSQKLNEANDAGHFDEVCPKFIEASVKIVMDMFPD
jgi:C_GCAxxG_C_C family probable redox protein